MTQAEIKLCSLLLQEHFGEIVEKVGIHLIKTGSQPLRLIVSDTGTPLQQVKKALCVLIQHNFVTYHLHKRGFVEYEAHPSLVLRFLRYPRYIYNAKTLYGDIGELLVEEVLQNGNMQMSCVVKKVSDRLTETMEGKGKRRRSSDDDTEPQAKRKKQNQEDGECSPDDGVYWEVNFERFHQHFRDQAIVSAVASKLDQTSSEIVRTMLRMSEVTTSSNAQYTQPLSSNEIFRALPSGYNISKQVLDQYLTLLADDPMEFVCKTGDSGGGMFAINLHKALASLARATLESVVQERFGSRSARIFRLLLRKRHLEQKQVEDFAMIPAKEAKDMLYTLLSQNLVSLQELPKTPDHAPSRTFYLYTVKTLPTAYMLLQKCYKTIANLIERRQFETKENKRLLEKSQRIEAIIASMQATGAEEQQLQEIEEMITAPERQQLEDLRRNVNKLDASENQVDETMFILESYIATTHSKA
ncbi:DNA-directed RNA polymerase III subunit RPC3 isoform X3 [Protopterus annectens]|uniref:DNA-directed RNA polymerase III subunit RPC3 isoform X3 n=1 Tax=Protopterus annectens TaxID=7888 RepID=UPI001CFA8652|nr:DNA-directed RNA polymerase III subunit RPC3 isoform X3 [Protopterus annectens]